MSDGLSLESSLKVLITGASGFIGKGLLNVKVKHDFRAAVREYSEALVVEQFVIGSFNSSTDWALALYNIDCVVHLAGLAHSNNIALSELEEINIKSTLNLAIQAGKSGVKRFIYLSSINVDYVERCIINGDKDTLSEQEDALALSKYKAEKGLKEIASIYGFDLVVIRSPLVYGPGVKANFQALIRLASMGLPLPFAKFNNLKSFVSIYNLADFLVTCIDHPAAPNELLYVSDGETISTSCLISKIGEYLGVKVLLFSIPISWLIFVFKVIGKQRMIENLNRSLLVDLDRSKSLLDWNPVISFNDALYKTVQNFKGKGD